MVSKGTFRSDLFEQFKDLGKVATGSAKDAAKTFSPVGMIESIFAPQSGEASKNGMEQRGETTPGKNSTKLDLAGLSSKHDQKELAAIRRRFQDVRDDESKGIHINAKETQDRTHSIAREEQQKHEQEQEKIRAQQSTGGLPAGRRHGTNALRKQKTVTDTHQEYRAGKSKQ